MTTPAKGREIKDRIKAQAEESPRGFVTAPTLDQLKPTPREQHLLGVLWDWLKQGSRSQHVLGHPERKDEK